MLKKISVIGGSSPSPKEYDTAVEVGREIASRKAVLICGGLGGVMEAAAKGAKEAGGITVGILPGTDKDNANPYIDLPITTGLGVARNVIVAQNADAVIAVGGALGTLSELVFALKMKKPVIGIGTWELDKNYCPEADIITARSAKEAVDKAFSLIK